MSLPVEVPAAAAADSPYLKWLAGEGVRVRLGHYVPDLAKVPVESWERIGGAVAVLNHEDSGSSNDCQVVEIAPGGALNSNKHLYEATYYVLSGSGTAEVWNSRGARQVFEWAAGSLFAIPMNAGYRLYNGSGSAAVRLLAVTTAPPTFNAFDNPDFVFGCDFDFTDRFNGETGYFGADGVLTGRIWESNFIEDVRRFELLAYDERGAGGKNVKLKLAHNKMWAHISEFPVGTYKKAHRHGPGAHVIVLSGTGYSLMWREGEEIKRYDWEEGSLVIPPDGYFHQHFNTGDRPARYLALRFHKAKDHPTIGRPMTTVSVKLGGDQIEYEDEDAIVREMYQNELAKKNIELQMKSVKNYQ